jgi:hypothetical protein
MYFQELFKLFFKMDQSHIYLTLDGKTIFPLSLMEFMDFPKNQSLKFSQKQRNFSKLLQMDSVYYFFDKKHYFKNPCFHGNI